VCREIRGHLVGLYWILLPLLVVFLIMLEFFKLPEKNPSAGNIIKRAIISMLLLFSLEECMDVIAIICDGITKHIDGIAKLKDLLVFLEKNYKNSEISFLKFREALIFIVSILSYIIAYLGVFITDVLIQFVWGVLYAVSPLMILMYVSDKTSFVTSNLYKGLLNVLSWKILASILGVMLLKLATAPQVGGWDNFITTVLINLCIGLSMLLVPFAAKSLMSDGMTSAASAMAAIPTMAVSKTIQAYSAKYGKRAVQAGRDTGSRAIKGAFYNVPKEVLTGFRGTRKFALNSYNKIKSGIGSGKSKTNKTMYQGTNNFKSRPKPSFNQKKESK